MIAPAKGTRLPAVVPVGRCPNRRCCGAGAGRWPGGAVCAITWPPCHASPSAAPAMAISPRLLMVLLLRGISPSGSAPGAGEVPLAAVLPLRRPRAAPGDLGFARADLECVE